MDEKPVLGVIGGSGLYEIAGLNNIEERSVETPHGEPSSSFVIGDLEGVRVAFVARHGVDHTYSPTEVPYRANIYALKALGVKRVISVSACGSLREDYKPGEIVVPNQLFDNTKDRARSFFDRELVAHVGVADPFCPDLSARVADSVESAGGKVRRTGAYITIEGPRFSTRAESNTFRAWGMSIVGMTTSPEAFLAREAELCYAVMAHITDYDVWHQTEEPVSADMVFQIVKQNTGLVQEAIRELLRELPESWDCTCQHALENSFATSMKNVSSEELERLALLVERFRT
ncbi:MAG: S-methyl-5'-thioadenosine phosphorylase [Anaerolineales bacterium]|nr:S-methyl-5'-thioadenosine phosphorylase [Anaerolineales bacterium]